MAYKEFRSQQAHRKPEGGSQESSDRASLLGKKALGSGSSEKPTKRGSLIGRQALRRLSSLRISSPFNFRRDKDQKEVSSQPKPSADLESKPSPFVPNLRPTYSSPINKPLPSIPTASTRRSRLVAGRSLIDATERPLQRSLSPSIVENWPTLCPFRKQVVSMDHSHTRPNKVSLGESVIERVRRLNLNDNDNVDDPVSRQVSSHSTPQSNLNGVLPTSRGSTPVKVPSSRSKQKLQVSKQPPVVRQTRTSELRKRLSSNPLTSDEPKKPRLGSSAAISNESHPTKSDGGIHNTRHSARKRSRSKHRVTSGGSPYAVNRVLLESDNGAGTEQLGSRPEDNNVPGLPSNPGQLLAPSNREFHDLDPDSEMYLVNVSGMRAFEHSPNFEDQQAMEATSDADVPPLYLTKRRVLERKHDIGNDGDVDTENEADDQHDDPALVTTPNKINMTTEEIKNYASVGFDERKGRAGVSPGSKSLVGTIYDEDEYEKFKVRPLSRSAPKYGPRLRVSESANEYLLGMKKPDAHPTLSNAHGSIENELRGSVPSAQSNAIEAEIADTKSSSKASGLEKDEELSSVEIEARYIQQAFTDIGVGTEAQHHQSKITANGHGNTDAPSVEPGAPRDNSKKIGWPFNESVVVPFKALESDSDNDGDTETDRKDLERNESQNSASKNVSHKKEANMSEVKLATNEVSKDHQVSPNLNLNKATPKLPTHSSLWSRNETIAQKPAAAVKSSPSTIGRGNLPVRALTANDTATSIADLSKSPSRKVRDAVGERCPGLSRVVSPTAESGRLSASKGVMHNIKGLFQKRNVEKKDGKAKQDDPGNGSKPGTNTALLTKSLSRNYAPRIPRSPRVKNTTPTIYERRQSRTDQRPFLKHRNVMTVATHLPLQGSSTAGQTVASQSNRSEKTTKLPIEPFPHLDAFAETANDSTSEPAELTKATSMVYDILNRAQDETQTKKKLAFIELSKLMVQALHAARDAEKAKEEARQHASKAEMECVKTRREILKVAEMVGKLLKMGDSGELEKHENVAGMI